MNICPIYVNLSCPSYEESDNFVHFIIIIFQPNHRNFKANLTILGPPDATESERLPSGQTQVHFYLNDDTLWVLIFLGFVCF